MPHRTARAETIHLALDAMGGDHAPDTVLHAAERILKEGGNIQFSLYGDEALIGPILNNCPLLKQSATLHHTPDQISNDEKPSAALRRGRNSSMGKAIRAVKQGNVDAMISGGNTGALMAMSKIVLRTLPGIDRPAIGAIMPTIRGDLVMLDLGANVYCSATNLFEFAVMGDAFARALLKKENPAIGLLNIGTEDMKGNEVVQEAAQLLQENDLELNFYGHIEGDHIGEGVVDVVVTDGFSGNIALKTAEGTAKLVTTFIRNAFKASILARIGALFSLPALRKLRHKLDPRLHNGAMFLGLNGIVVKSHGGTDAVGFANAIRVAETLVREDINRHIVQEMMQSGHISADDDLPLHGLQEEAPDT